MILVCPTCILAKMASSLLDMKVGASHTDTDLNFVQFVASADVLLCLYGSFIIPPSSNLPLLLVVSRHTRAVILLPRFVDLKLPHLQVRC